MENYQEKYEELKKMFDSVIADICEDDTSIRKECEKVFTDYEVYGDSYGVPPITDLVEKLVKELINKEHQ